MKRAFKVFSNLTDADAVRLAAGARGILMRHLWSDAARAFQRALRAEGVGTAIVAENDLPELPEAQSLIRAEPWPQAFTVYDPFGRPKSIAWGEITLLAAGAVQSIESGKTQTEFLRLQNQAATDARPRKAEDAGRRIKSDSQLSLEILVGPDVARYQIEGAQFMFKHVIDRPGLSLEEKFVWLVREICRCATQAALNAGAQSLLEGRETVPDYRNRQALVDEIVWLLWRNAQQKRLRAP